MVGLMRCPNVKPTIPPTTIPPTFSNVPSISASHWRWEHGRPARHEVAHWFISRKSSNPANSFWKHTSKRVTISWPEILSAKPDYPVLPISEPTVAGQGNPLPRPALAPAPERLPASPTADVPSWRPPFPDSR